MALWISLVLDVRCDDAVSAEALLTGQLQAYADANHVSLLPIIRSELLWHRDPSQFLDEYFAEAAVRDRRDSRLTLVDYLASLALASEENNALATAVYNEECRLLDEAEQSLL
jgi:hypothetical protein